MEEYRCDLTYDIEELIEMSKEEPTKIKVTATYNSGRIEEINGNLNKGGIPCKKIQDQILALKSFPTVCSVDIEKT